MAIPAGFRSVATIITQAKHDELYQAASDQGTSVSKMLSTWIETGIAAPVQPARRRRHSVRAYKDELMISLPRDFIRATGLEKGDQVHVSWGQEGLIVSFEKSPKS